jgi:hexosaminidase
MQPAKPLSGEFSIEALQGDLCRVVPGTVFRGLEPGASMRFEYLSTGLIANIGDAPAGPYIVYDSEPLKGFVIDYVAVPFTRAPLTGSDARVVSPEAQYALNEQAHDLPLGALPPVFPTPLRLEKREGSLRLSALPKLSVPTGLASEAALVLDYMRSKRKVQSSPTTNSSVLELTIGRIAGQESPEAYEILVDPATGIHITGNSTAGVFYGVQTLRSLLPANPASEVSVPALHIVDAPRFAYRGLMLDVSRNFQPKTTILHVLDLMARYKLNTLHFHLTDDEGWRLAIPGLPELTAVGARRGHTLDSLDMLQPAYGSGPDPDRPYGSGFYSRADYIEIVRRAKALQIEVIPEIEMPGHARAAMKSMEARFRALQKAGDTSGAGHFRLVDPADQSVYTSAQQYHDNVMNPALESTYAFIETVVREVALMHRDAGAPLKHLHVGGDEVPTGVWERSPAAEAFMKEHALTKTRDLWFVFYTRVERILKSHGLALSGWEEMGIRDNGVNTDFAGRDTRVYVWNNVAGGGAEDLAYRLANGDYKVVLTPVTNLYFDLAYNKNPEERGLHWGGYLDVDKPFAFIPLDYYRGVHEDRFGNPIDRSVFAGKMGLSSAGQSNIIGIQGNLWSETLGADGRLDAMLLPKLFGLAERAWAPDPEWARERDESKAAGLYREAWSVFVNVLGKRELPRLVHEQPNTQYRIPTPGLRVTPQGAILANLQFPGFSLRYTTDGSEPTVKSPEARGPITVRGSIRVAAFDATGRRGHSAVVNIP